MIDLSSLWNKVEEDCLKSSSNIGAVVYTLTSSYAWYLLPSLTSLLRTNHTERVYLITDTTRDNWPYTLPDNVIVLDYSNQRWFNRGYSFSVYCLLRMCLTKIIPEDRCLSLDCDTIVEGSLQPLYEVDFENNYFGMVNEYNTSRKLFATDEFKNQNFNCGVLLLNLKQMREDHIDDLLITYWNVCNIDYGCGEQDVINVLFPARILPLSARYNASTLTLDQIDFSNFPVVVHYCFDNSWMLDDKYHFLGKYLDYYKLYIEHYSGLTLKDCLPV